MLAPVVVVGQGLLGILDGSVFGAELLAELRRAGGTYLYALAAGHAVFGVDVRSVSGGGHVRRVEQLARAQGEAGAERAVADGKDLILTVDVRDLVDVAVVLRALQDFHRLFIGNGTAHVVFFTVFRKLADRDAQLILQLAAAVAGNAHGVAAGAVAHAELSLILLQPVREMLNVHRLVLRGNGFLDRNDVHTDARASGGHHRGDLRQRHKCHIVKELRDFRVLLRLLDVHVHELCTAGNKDGQNILLLMVCILPVVLQKADARHLIEQRSHFLSTLADFFRKFLRCDGHTDVHRQRKLRHLIRDDACKAIVLRRICVQLRHAKLDIDSVCDLFAQFQNQFSFSRHFSGSFPIL